MIKHALELAAYIFFAGMALLWAAEVLEILWLFGLDDSPRPSWWNI